MKKVEKEKKRRGIRKLSSSMENKKGQEGTLKKIILNLPETKKSAMPSAMLPMLATLSDTPVMNEGWFYEVKWDGFRCLTYLENGEVELKSRNNKSFNEKFYPLFNIFRQWEIDVVLDGEIIVIDKNGLADFNALQLWRSEADGDLVYYVFDILWLEGYDLTSVRLDERRKILKQIVPDSGSIRISESFDVKGSDFFSLARELNLEGIMAKRSDSYYYSGRRSKEWLKIKTIKQQEAIIAGYTKNKNSTKPFSSLLLGIYEKGELMPIAPIGTGFTVKLQKELLEKLEPLKTDVCPFSFVPDFNKPSRFRPNPPK